MRLVLSTFVVACFVLSANCGSLFAQKLRLRPKLAKRVKKPAKPRFKVLSAKSLKSWARSQKKFRQIRLPKALKSTFPHPSYGQSGVLLGVGRPYDGPTKSSIYFPSVKFDKELFAAIRTKPLQATAFIPRQRDMLIAKAIFRKLGTTPRLSVVTLGMQAPKEFWYVRVISKTTESIPPASWQWNETAQQYQTFLTIVPNENGVIRFDIRSDLHESLYFSFHFHHIQLIVAE